MAVRNTRPGGLLMVAPPCATWVFLCSAVTGRSWSNPGGNSQRCVELANILVLRLIYILFYAVKRNVKILIEQPQSSVMWMWRPVRKFLHWAGCRTECYSFLLASACELNMESCDLWHTW
ncbi:unnamed protein product [Cladocopium goreaui]|nr:unnamed protein product [Cladocopium goreaui]